MEKITLPKASQMTSPNPVTIVCTQKPDGSTNLATVSWWTYLSYNPNMIAYAMAKTFYSGEMVRNNKKSYSHHSRRRNCGCCPRLRQHHGAQHR